MKQKNVGTMNHFSDKDTFNPYLEKDQVKRDTKTLLKEIAALQYQMYAQQKYSLLVVFQGLDASGKDGLTRGLLHYCNPIGIRIKSFKKPTAEELSHDFLWRVHQETPAKGELQIFIRSHYEDILVPTVEKLFPEEMVEQRYELINRFEQQLLQNNTQILKFFLHVSPEAQKERLLERIELREKHWKHKDGDWDTREKFDKYLHVYDRILDQCNVVPWHVIPADKNWQKLYFVAKEVHQTLKGLPLEWPALESERF